MVKSEASNQKSKENQRRLVDVRDKSQIYQVSIVKKKRGAGPLNWWTETRSNALTCTEIKQVFAFFSFFVFFKGFLYNLSPSATKPLH